jgi:hypothetical protein
MKPGERQPELPAQASTRLGGDILRPVSEHNQDPDSRSWF